MRIDDPESVGISGERLKRLDLLMQEYVDSGKIAGVVTLIARYGKVVHLGQFGMMDLKRSKPMRADTIFRIFSMTKPITSVAMMMLYEEGLFNLQDPVSKFIPEFDSLRVLLSTHGKDLETVGLEREITIKDLFTHTAGLGYAFLDVSHVDQMHVDANLYDRDSDLENFIHKLVELPLACQPGTRWRYSCSVDVLGYLVEVLSDMSLDSFFENRIFAPLGMEDTSFRLDSEKLDRFPSLYGITEDGSIGLLEAPETSPYLKPLKLFMGGHGLLSTITDYFRFAQMLLNGGVFKGARILGRKTVELMTKNYLDPSLIPITMEPITIYGCGFGLGFRVVTDPAMYGLLGSSGLYAWGGAASTGFFVDPKEQLIGVVMPQFRPSTYYPIRNQFEVLINQALIE
jgi:CubicO group peptidase (beta-lactamase class C family)